MSHLSADRARAALLRALAPHAAPYRLLSAHSRDWASALFEGARHRLVLAMEGEDGPLRAERLGRTLTEMELAMRGGFVADIQAVVRMDSALPVLAIEALTIEDAEAPVAGAVSPGERRRAG
jgi:hypothetical protein